MRGSKRMRVPSPAMVVACLALIVALSGAAYAAANLPPNSVGTAQLKNGAVTSTKVIRNGLTLADLGASNSKNRLTVSVPVSTAIPLAADACVYDDLGLTARPNHKEKVFGSLLVGNLTDGSGGAAVDGAVTIAPTMLIPKLGGGATVGLIVCNDSSTAETIPAGSMFHLHLILPS